MSFPFLDFESSFFTNEELLFLAGASGGGVEHTIINNPATFTTDLAKPLRRLLIPFSPVQSGSGDPSPSNVRPITGLTGLNIYRSGEDTSDPLTVPVSWQTEAGEVYGGALDALTGVLTVTHIEITKNTADMNNTENYPGWQDADVAQYIGSGFDRKFNIPTNVTKFYEVNTRQTSGTIYFAKSSFGLTQAEWIALGLDVQIIIELATPQTIQLDPVTLSTLIGENVIWTDTNGDNTIVYLKKT